MNKQAAVQLLEKTFGNSFDKEKFSVFIKEVFNRFEFSYKSWDVWNEYKDYIGSLELLGSYECRNRVIDVIVVKLKKSSSIERARAMQRNFVAKYLSTLEKDAALVAFYYDGESDWRFSFVKMEYRLKENVKGKMEAEKDITPAKRYSFLVGKNEPNHTCKRQFLELVTDEGDDISLENLESAFSVEKVTKEFFNEYKELYLELKESLDRIIRRNSSVKKEFEEKGISSVDFSKKLLGQIVFIYFLQKKGWLGVNRQGPWGDGPKNFLRKLFNKEIVTYDNFFNDVLEPLFYEALARPHDEDYFSRFDCKIPFLNGGLFEPIENYNWVSTDIILDNSIFEKILDTFDKYNFTIKEDEPLEKEVAIDPEMLGKVFENLLEIRDRKSSGRYYTPREIVHYMCQQSLINYLEVNTSIPREDIEKFIEFGDIFGSENVTSESIVNNAGRIDLLLKNVKIVDPAVGSGAFPVEIMTEIVKARTALTQFITEDERSSRTNYNLKRETIENSLYGVDIDSSAVDIAKLRFWLSLIVDEADMQNIKPLPNLDHKIMVGDSLLEAFEGVRIFDDTLLGGAKKNGHEIKIIDEKMGKIYHELGEIHKGIRKYDGTRLKEIQRELKKLKLKKKKIGEIKGQEIQATIEESSENRIKQSRVKLIKLKELQVLFFNEQDRSLKKQLAEQIDKIEWELIVETLKEQGNEEATIRLKQYMKSRSKPFFIWKLYFAEVFLRENPGFDIVIANPPYVQLQLEHGKLADLYEDAGYQTFTRTGDIYCLFYEKANELMRKKGTACYITSNKWMRAGYGEYLRRYLSTYTQPLVLIDLGPDIFETATVDTNILIFRNSKPSNQFLGCNLKKKIQIPLSIFVQSNSISITAPTAGSMWEIRTMAQQKIAEKIEKYGVTLKDWGINIYRGVLTGYNDAFIIDNTTKERLCKEDPKNKNVIKPIIRGRDLSKFHSRWENVWIIFIPWHFPIQNDSTIVGASTKAEKEFKTEYSSLYKYFLQYKPKLMDRNKDETGIRYEWYALQRHAADYYQHFSKEKIVWKRIGSIMRFSYDNTGAYCLDSTCIATGEKIKFLVGVLNSKLCLYELFRISPQTGTGDQIISVQALEPLRVPIPDAKQEKEVTTLVDEILSLMKDSDYGRNEMQQSKVKELEKKIDHAVYNLYRLTPEDIKIVEEKFNIEEQLILKN